MPACALQEETTNDEEENCVRGTVMAVSLAGDEDCPDLTVSSAQGDKSIHTICQWRVTAQLRSKRKTTVECE